MDSLTFSLWRGSEGMINVSVVVGIMIIEAWKKKLYTKIKEIFEHAINEFVLSVLSRENSSPNLGILVLKMEHIH